MHFKRYNVTQDPYVVTFPKFEAWKTRSTYIGKSYLRKHTIGIKSKKHVDNTC